MSHKNIVQHKDRIDHLFNQVASLPADSFELQSHWARYLCVLVSGYIEKSVQTLLAEAARKQSSPTIANYVANKMRDFQNAKMEKILDLLHQFNPVWEEKVRIATEGEYRDAIDSIVNNRHQIVHGGTVGISYSVVRRYYQGVVKVIEIIEAECS